MRALVLAIAWQLFATQTSFADSRPVVVELFTSQGCSSCPPADALLTSLAGRRDILPLAFHVTYWNALGWRDPYSSEAATDRQARYAARLGGGSYTPEMVIDGQRGMVGSDRGAVTAAITAARGGAVDATSLQVTKDSSGISIKIGAGSGRGQILVVGYDPRHETNIGRGENTGRRLVESNIVRSIRVVGRYDGTAIRRSVPRGAGTDAAVIIQADDGRIVAAARL